MATTTAKDLGELGAGNEIQRVRRIVIDSTWNGEDKIRILQEKFVEVSGSKVHKDKAAPINRKYSEVSAESYTFDGVTATVEQIRGLIVEAVNAWRVEDAS